jgi:DoxX-like family
MPNRSFGDDKRREEKNAIPGTSILGAILLTGYLGGAVATHVRVSDPLFETLFPVIFGVLTWAGIFLRDDRLRTLIPLRR